MLQLNEIKFVADFRTAMSWWSMKLGVVASMVVAYIVANPDALKQLADYLPEQYRTVYSGLIGVVTFAVIYFTRNVKQPDKAAKPNG